MILKKGTEPLKEMSLVDVLEKHELQQLDKRGLTQIVRVFLHLLTAFDLSQHNIQ